MKKRIITLNGKQFLYEEETTQDKLFLDFELELQAKFEAEEAEKEFLEEFDGLTENCFLKKIPIAKPKMNWKNLKKIKG